VTLPPDPFNPEVFTLAVGEPVYRVFRAPRGVDEFRTSGPTADTRFAFFGDPNAPVLYGAETDQAAVCETVLHDIPQSGGAVLPTDYQNRAVCLLRPSRDLQLASFMGTGLKRLGVEAKELTDTESAHYPETNKWAEAAHANGHDGISWMSRKCNSDRAYVFFGDRVSSDDFEQDDSYARAFANPDDFNWLVDFCAPLHVEVLIEMG